MPSRLSRNLANMFPSVIRSRGREYYLAGFVNVINGSPSSLEASVAGSRPYEVSVEFAENGLQLHCSCPYFSTDGPCKHLWAAVLAAESRGHLSGLPDVPEGNMGRSADEFDASWSSGAEPPIPKKPTAKPVLASVPPPWKTRIAAVRSEKTPSMVRDWPAKRQIFYAVDLNASVAHAHVVLSLLTRDLKANGEFGRAVALRMQRGQIDSLRLAEDREILSSLAGAAEYYGFGGYTDAQYRQIPASSALRYPLSKTVLQLAGRTGRLFLRRGLPIENMEPLVWDDGEPWRLALEVRAIGPDAKAEDKPVRVRKGWVVAGVLRRGTPDTSGTPGAERMDVSTPVLVAEGLMIAEGRVAPLHAGTEFGWMGHLRRKGSIEVPAKDRDDMIATLLGTPGVPPLEVPEELRYEEITVAPRPGVRIRSVDHASGDTLNAEIFFEYDGTMVTALGESAGFYEPSARRLVRRDPVAEKAALELAGELGFRFRPVSWYQARPQWDLHPARMPRAVRALLDAGWHIDADGKVFHRPGEFHMEVSSGVDWFELHGGVEFGNTSAQLPELLEALRRGDNMVKLGDGSYGVLPEEWLRRIGTLAGMGTAKDGHIRFRPSQAGLLDALLATQPEAIVDETFGRAREELRRFRSVEAVGQPEGFVGCLRDYQREGLGWLEFLQRFSFGGCLADDMGVGKTAQVLALLENRRVLRAEGKVGPSLVVVPRSLIFNWKQEAERFTPQLRVLDYTGLTRGAVEFDAFDLILTTYGTLRRDVARLKDVEFDYVVLDEAQAVKNAGTESAKAVRLLRGAHRLAMSGTPVENHLGELWSLFEFLNPGMLGAASVFRLANGSGRTIDEDSRKLLSQALRPFILRRTKDQVVKELPAKTEQTIYCELEPQQRKLYNELRDHYRLSLLKKVETHGLGKSKIMVLEALLRLRQAACHPGLIDAERSGEPSAKLEALLEQIREVTDAGHKALVFSQFTSLLKIVRERLDSEGLVYEYLDGKTRDRQARVERFQNDEDCRLFLISLKAGGLGLNLTAAEYVFILDPWWNPAVEAQAVDRAHRIGQKRAVFAYRLIARDTVEEKVLELQKSKRDLAAAIIGEDNALIRNLKREDLELLLS